ncbi:MAG: MFS transporter [Anaerolineae bacterium]|nr:MFS transporter [Anaerolineae bacterium]
MTAIPSPDLLAADNRTYQRRIFSWTLYDWANSAFVTTILAAILPVYYSTVAGASLSSEAQATAYWSIGLSISLLIGALISPVLGTVSDISRTKKRFLGLFTMLGALTSGLLVLVNYGDWMLASVLFIIARIGFLGSTSFYDSLLPHVARPEDRDSVSARGYAMGYLGGGILLAINIVMLQTLPGLLGAQLSFASVAVWWLVFSIPLFRRVPEPPAVRNLLPGETVFSATIKQLTGTFSDIRRYRELFKFLIAFLIYNDAIGTIISLAVIYGAELGFGSVELVLALLLVQFVGIPFSLMFGRLPSPKSTRRSFYLAFMLFNLVVLPLVGISGSRLLPADMSGVPAAAFETHDGFVGQGLYGARDHLFNLSGQWETQPVTAAESRQTEDVESLISRVRGDALTLQFNGKAVELTYIAGPQSGSIAVLLDGLPHLDPETGSPMVLDTFNETTRYGETVVISAPAAGQHTLTLSNDGEEGADNLIAIQSIGILQPERETSLPVILGVLLLIQGIGLIFAALTQRLFSQPASTLTTKRSIMLALVFYSVIAVWGFLLDSSIEFWFLAWLVAIVQGGSQALSRSLYASLSPARKSGEFFGIYGVMEKFSAIIGPLIFALAVALFGSSRPAIISLIAFFIIGGYLLAKVNVSEGQRVAQEEDDRLAAENG